MGDRPYKSALKTHSHKRLSYCEQHFSLAIYLSVTAISALCAVNWTLVSVSAVGEGRSRAISLSVGEGDLADHRMNRSQSD